MASSKSGGVPGRMFWQALLTGVGFFLLGYGGLLLSGHGQMISLIWPANAFAVCMILRLSRSGAQDALMLAGTGLGEFCVNLATGAPLLLNAGFVAVSLVQVTGAAAAGRKFGARRFKNIPNALLFIAAAILAPALAGALLAGGIMVAGGDANWMTDTQRWLVSNVLGFSIVLPIGLAISHRKFAKLRLGERRLEAAIVFLGVIAVSLFSIRYLSRPMPFLTLPVILAAAVRFRFLGAGLAMILVVLVMLGAGATVNIPYPDFVTRVQVMQVFLAITSLICTRAAMLLNERDLHLALIEGRRRQALRASRFKSQLLAHVGEEARGPLSAIIGISNMLESGKLPPGRAEEFAHIVAHNGELLQRLYGDLLDLAEAETGALAIAPVPVAVGPTLRDCVGAIRLDAALGGKPVLVGEIEENLRVQADPRRLAQIINNLIANSYKYGDNHSPIRVRASRLGDGFGRIEILNAGPGISRSERETLFQPFGRESGGRLVPGAGLGLSIAKLLAERQGGRIDCESIPGRQTRFWIDLPLAA